MHLKAQQRGVFLDKQDEKKIIDFLTYDSQVRKVKGKAEFEAQQEHARKLFEAVTRERDRLMAEQVSRLPKKEFHYTGVK